MIRNRFTYHVPSTVQEVTDLLAQGGDDTDLISGGTWVVPEMTRGLRRPAQVIDLRRIDLAGVSRQNGTITVGPLTTYTELETSDAAPALLREMARGITGGAQVRNQGTVGGSACYANPASDVPGALVALEATMRLSSARGDRDVPAAEFFRGAYETERGSDEVLSAILLPAPADGMRCGYEKFKVAQGSWPIVTAACTTDGEGAVRSLVVGGAAATPVRVDVGDGPLDLDVLAQQVFDAIAEPWTDALAPGKYRKAISGVIAKRAVQAALNTSERETT